MGCSSSKPAPKDPNAGWTMAYAKRLERDGKFDKALKQVGDVLEYQEYSLGADHPSTLSTKTCTA